MLSAILGRKVGMTQIFGPNGAAIAATVIEAGPCTVTQVKSAGTDGYEAVQIGYDQIHPERAKRPAMGHLGHTLEPTPHQRRKQQQQGARDRQRRARRRLLRPRRGRPRRMRPRPAATPAARSAASGASAVRPARAASVRMGWLWGRSGCCAR